MNICRAYLLMLAILFSGAVSYANANTMLPQSTFGDWTGVVVESALPDGSFLFEYVARTFSGRVEGAMLALVFVPRFGCAPVMTLRVPDSYGKSSEKSALLVEFDGKQKTYITVTDSTEGYTTYALAADADEQAALRRSIDTSARVSFSLVDMIPVESAGDAEQAAASSDSVWTENVVFSLVGSGLTTQAVDARCSAHEPVPFSLN